MNPLLLILKMLDMGMGTATAASTAVLDVIVGKTYGDSIVGRTQGDAISGRTYGDSITGRVSKDG